MAIGGGKSAGAEPAANRLVAGGAGCLVSFGLAGGLHPALRPGQVVIPSGVLYGSRRFQADPGLMALFGGPTGHVLLAEDAIATDAAMKRDLHHRSGAHAVDLESGPVAVVAARRGVPFAVVRAICDPAERDLPPAATVALDQAGAIGFWRVLANVCANPRQIPALLGLARDAAAARKALVRLCDRISAAG